MIEGNILIKTRMELLSIKELYLDDISTNNSILSFDFKPFNIYTYSESEFLLHNIIIYEMLNKHALLSNLEGTKIERNQSNLKDQIR
jgi:hypothetical protein